MINPEDSAKLDQGFAAMREIASLLPGVWYDMHSACVLAGFTPFEALQLVKAYIISQGTGNKCPPT